MFSFLTLLSFEKANAQTYSFSITTQTYTALSGDTVVSTDFGDEDVFSIPIPFTFNFYDANFTTLYINNGTAMFHNPNVQAGYEMYVCDADLIDLGTTSTLSPISYNWYRS